MNLKYLGPEYQRDWEELTKNNPETGFMQSFFWAEFKNLIGWETFKIGVFENNKLIAGAIIGKYSHQKDYNFFYIPEGPVIPYSHPEAKEIFDLLMTEIDKLVDFKGNKKTSHISIEPKIAKVPDFFSRFVKAPSDRQPLKNLILNLNQSEQAILKQMKPKGRYNIKVAQKHDVEVFSLNPSEGLHYFLPIYRSFTKKSRFEGKNDDYFQNLSFILDKYEQGNMYFAKYDDQILAAALVVYFGNTATYLFGASRKEYKNVMAPYLLHFRIIQEAKEAGYEWYDWYGVSPDEKNEEHPWHGFTVFKNKFGGKKVNYIGGYDFVYNDRLYKQYLKELA